MPLFRGLNGIHTHEISLVIKGSKERKTRRTITRSLTHTTRPFGLRAVEQIPHCSWGTIATVVPANISRPVGDPTKKEGRPEGRPNAVLKWLEEELAGEDHIANSGSESRDSASLGSGVEEVIEAAEVGVTQIGSRRSIV